MRLLFSLFLCSFFVMQISCAAKKEAVPHHIGSGKLFSALVQFVNSEGLWHNNPELLKRNLRIDLRLMDADITSIGELEEKKLHKDSQGLDTRKKVLKSKKIPIADAIADQNCIHGGGVPPPPDPSDTTNYERPEKSPYCEERGSFITIIFSRLQSTDISNCKSSQPDLDTNAVCRCIEVKALELTSYSNMMYALYIFKSSKNKKWQVVRKELLGGAAS